MLNLGYTNARNGFSTLKIGLSNANSPMGPKISDPEALMWGPEGGEKTLEYPEYPGIHFRNIKWAILEYVAVSG